MNKKEAVLRKPIGTILPLLGLLLFAVAAISVCAQMSPRDHEQSCQTAGQA
jgi:hypothetical protein